MTTATASLALLSRIPVERWQALSARRIWFGHQSVGGNIVQGLADLAASADAPVPAPVAANGEPLPRGFSHGAIGHNTDPHSKLDAFQRFVGDTLHGEVDVAFFKFCYVDIGQSTDVDALAADYRRTMDAMAEGWPEVRFVHVTCPLTVVTPPWRARLKRMLGRAEPGFAANAARERFNRLLRDAYLGREPIFDLAAVESTRPDGSQCRFRYEGEDWPALVPGYSHDGRHLGEDGRRWAAAHLLETLATLP